MGMNSVTLLFMRSTSFYLLFDPRNTCKLAAARLLEKPNPVPARRIPAPAGLR